MHARLWFAGWLVVANAVLSAQSSAWARQGGCGSSTGPDVVIGELPNIGKWGTVGGITSYSLATTACNFGDAVLPWYDSTNQHPVIAQHLYRYRNGRFEQLGISWVKHGFGALTQNACSCGCIDPGNFFLLGVGCSDPYTTQNG